MSRLDRMLDSGSCNIQQLMSCVEPAIEKYDDLVSDNKHLTTMKHFALSELLDFKQHTRKVLNEKILKEKRDAATQEPELDESSCSSESSDSDDEKARRVTRDALKTKLRSRPSNGPLEFNASITDAEQLNFDPASTPIPTPWKMKRRSVKWFKTPGDGEEKVRRKKRKKKFS